MAEYWYSRWLFERALAAIYLIAFIAAAVQFVPLLGERGLEPIGPFVKAFPFRASPSLFFFAPHDIAFRIAAWIGVAISCLLLFGYPLFRGWAVSATAWAAVWVMYLSFVNVGQTFYGFGWESLLCEVGFFTIFAGASNTPPQALLNWIYRWTLFRLMFGAGLIKLRGDPCWRDLTCLDYYFETQPMPNPLSWYFHWLPRGALHGGVVINHVCELIVPFGYFLPQPYAGIAGLITIAFQGMLIVSGNLSWLNYLTIVLAFTTLDDRFLSWLPVAIPQLRAEPVSQRFATYGLAALVALLSVAPVLNMLSPGQVMNTAFNPLQIVNTYGAFGSITKERNEIVIEGTDEQTLTDATTWREYEFKGKPGDPAYRPPLVAPYHMRLDWLMWFAAMGSAQDEPWFPGVILHLLQGDGQLLGLLRVNPFPDHSPRWIRASLYRYRFTTPAERSASGLWWHRERVAEYFPAVRLPAH